MFEWVPNPWYQCNLGVCAVHSDGPTAGPTASDHYAPCAGDNLCLQGDAPITLLWEIRWGSHIHIHATNLNVRAPPYLL